MTNPTVNVSVTADIQALQTGMKRAEATVATSSAAMASQIERGFGARFDNTFGNINRGFGRVGKGAQVGLAVANAAAGDLDGTLSALPGTLGLVAMVGKTTFDILHESITGTENAAKKLDEALARGQRIVNYRQQAEDLDRQIKIMQTGDEKAARRLQTEREIAAAQQRFMQANTEGATVEAKAALDREIKLVKMREEKDLLEIHLKLNDEMMRKIEARNKKAEEQEREERDRIKNITDLQRRAEDARGRFALAQQNVAEDPVLRTMMEMRQKLREIRREHEDMSSYDLQVGGDLALNEERRATIAETNLRLSEMRVEAQEDLNDLQEEFNNMSGTTDVETSFGGPMRVALEGGGRMSSEMAKKQTVLQERIAKIVEAISKNVVGPSGIQ